MSALLALALLALLADARLHKNGPVTANSSTIAITSDDRFVWVVNRDNNSVSKIKIPKNAQENAKGFKGKISEIKVGMEPRCVAITPDDKKVFVTNMIDGTVS